MVDPHAFRAMRMLGETVGGQSRVATPGNKPRLRPIVRRVDLCPVQVSTPEIGETLLGIAGDSLYTIQADVVATDALIYRYLLSQFTSNPATVSPAETLTAASMFDYSASDYVGQGVIDGNSDIYQWRYDSGLDDYELQRWTESGGVFTVDDPSVTTQHNLTLVQSYNPLDDLLYVLQAASASGFGYPPIEVRTVVGADGTTANFSDDDVDPDNYNSLGADEEPFPLFTPDGSVWVPWYGTGSDGGIFHIASDGTTQQFNYDETAAPPFNLSQLFWFGLPYGTDKLLAIDNVDFKPWILDNAGTVTEATGAGCLAFAQAVEDTDSFNFIDRVIYGGGYAWVFLSDSAQLWRSPFQV